MSAYIITPMSSTLLSDEEVTWLVEKGYASYNGKQHNGHDCYELVCITLPQARELIALFNVGHESNAEAQAAWDTEVIPYVYPENEEEETKLVEFVPLSLDAFCKLHNITLAQYGKDALLVFFADLPKDASAKAELWHLSDYVVSSAVSGPAYVLVPRI